MWKIEAVIMLALVAALVGSASGADKPAPKSAEVRTDLAQYPQGQQVKIDLVITNTASEAQEYRFSSGKQFDMWITRDDTEVWRWSRGHMFIQMFTHLSLQPGESKTFSGTWDQRDVDGKQVPAGSYVVSGQLTPTGEKPAAMSTKIEILADGKSAKLENDSPKNTVTVLGEVKRPGRYPVTATTTVRDAVQLAGGLGDYADVGRIQVGRIVGSKRSITKINWSKKDSKNGSARFHLKPGDSVYVKELDNAPIVIMLGELVSPRHLPVTPDLTLTKAIALVGGLTPHARTSEISIGRIIPGAAGQRKGLTVNLEDISAGRKADPKLQPGDIVQVPRIETDPKGLSRIVK